MPFDWEAGVARILPASTDVNTTPPRGAGLVVSDDGLVVTCAHVVMACRGAGRSGVPATVQVVFDGTGDSCEATVLRDRWLPVDGGDVAMLRLDGPLPVGVAALPLGPAAGATGHAFWSMGYPNGALDAELGKGGILKVLRHQAGGALLQLESAQVTTGFSGGPVWSEPAGRVVGMVSSIAPPDDHGRGAETAFATPSDTIQALCPELQLSEECPYRGLEPYGVDDARFFFGREELIELLLAKVREEPPVMAVLGPSGSGKSSVIQAGLIPRLASDPAGTRWTPLVIRHYDAIAAAVAQSRVAIASPGRTLLVLDQFEELLVSRPSTDQREVLDRVTRLAGSGEAATTVLVMRDDFYSTFTALAPEELKTRALANIVQIPATLTRAELGRMITGPASAVGLRFEDGLADRIARDALAVTGGDGTVRSTVLPLLEFALTQLWERRRDGYLTHDAYAAIGEVTGGLATWANRALLALDREGEDLRPLARRIMLDLVQFGDERRGIPDSRRSRPVRALARQEDFDEVQHVVEMLIDNRLLLPSGGTDGAPERVELIHDALIREWGELRGWIAESRQFRRWLQDLDQRCLKWVESAPNDIDRRDTGLLLRGGELAEAEHWRGERPDDLASDQRTCIDRSIELRDLERQNEIATQSRLRRYLVAASVAAALLLLSTVIAVVQFNEAEESADEADRQAELTLIESLAAQARIEEARGADEQSALLALAAHELDDEGASEGPVGTALQASAGSPYYSTLSESNPSPVSHLGYSADGRAMAAIREDGSLRVRRDDTEIICAAPVDANGRPRALRSHAVTFNGDGSMLAVGSDDGYIRLWRLDGETCALAGSTAGPGGKFFAVAFADGPGGPLLATGTCLPPGNAYLVEFERRAPDCLVGSARVQLWSWGDTLVLDSEWRIDGSAACAVAISPDGAWLAASGCGEIAPDAPVCDGEPGPVVLWDLDARDQPPRCLTGHDGEVNALAFDRCDGTLASAGDDRTVRLWNPADGAVIRELAGHRESVRSVAFSHNCQFLASTGEDGMVGLWHLTQSEPVIIDLGANTQHVRTLAFGGADGMDLTAESNNGRTRTWHLGLPVSPAPGVLRGHDDYIRALAFSPAADALLLASAAEDGTVRLWDLANAEASPTMPLFGEGGAPTHVVSLAFNRDGSLLALGGNDGRFWLWEPGSDIAIDPVFDFPAGGDVTLAFHPTENQLVAGTSGGYVHLWDAGSRERHGDSVLVQRDSQVTALALSPDGTLLVVANDEGAITIWTWSGTGLGAMPIGSITHGEGVNALAFSPDGFLLASGGNDHVIRIRETTNGFRQVARLGGHDDEVRSLVFAPSGESLVSGSRDQTIRFWDTTDYDAPPVVILDAQEWVRALAISPDGAVLAAAATQGSVRLIVPDTDTLAAMVCDRVTRNLSEEEWSLVVESEERWATCPNLPPPATAIANGQPP